MTKALGRSGVAGVLALAVLGGCAAGAGSGGGPSRTADGGLALSGVFGGGGGPASGEVKTADRGAGVFTARGGGGLSCTGSFQVFGEETQFVPFTCSNGRNGQAVVTIRDDRVSGSIVLVYDTGPQRDYARFAFGSLPFSEAFEATPKG